VAVEEAEAQAGEALEEGEAQPGAAEEASTAELAEVVALDRAAR
jgi:hypothetical protein